MFLFLHHPWYAVFFLFYLFVLLFDFCFLQCKTVILAQRYLSARGVDTGIGSFTDTNMRIWLQIADGYIQLPSSQEVAAGMHQYTVEPYDPVVTLGQAGAQTRSVFPSQDDYKADYLRQISELLPRSTRLPEPVSTSSSSSSVGAVPGTESDFLAAGVSNETLLEHIKFLHSHVSSLTSGMEQLQQQLALTQLINKQLVSMTQLQDRAIAQNDSNSK